jgi:nitrogen regulatory protein PII
VVFAVTAATIASGAVAEAIRQAGDGRVLVPPVEDAVGIRTGERGPDAV